MVRLACIVDPHDTFVGGGAATDAFPGQAGFVFALMRRALIPSIVPPGLRYDFEAWGATASASGGRQVVRALGIADIPPHRKYAMQRALHHGQAPMPPRWHSSGGFQLPTGTWWDQNPPP